MLPHERVTKNQDFISLLQFIELIFYFFEYLQIQQTPKPEAQVPSVVPPLVEHSSLKVKKYHTIFRNFKRYTVSARLQDTPRNRFLLHK